MQVCTVVLNQAMDSLAVSAVGNTIWDACSNINTDVIADYLTDLDESCKFMDEEAICCKLQSVSVLLRKSFLTSSGAKNGRLHCGRIGI